MHLQVSRIELLFDVSALRAFKNSRLLIVVIVNLSLNVRVVMRPLLVRTVLISACPTPVLSAVTVAHCLTSSAYAWRAN